MDAARAPRRIRRTAVRRKFAEGKDVTLQPETGSELSYNRATAAPRQPRTAVPTRSPVPQPTCIRRISPSRSTWPV